MQRRFPHGSLRSNGIGALISIVGVRIGRGAVAGHICCGFTSPAVELSLRNTLRSLAADAVVIVQTDLAHFGIGYLQGALGRAPRRHRHHVAADLVAGLP